MCGIGGKLSFDGRPDTAVAERMINQLEHRGPDDSGVYANGPVVLAHRRLSILDPTEAGRQPMSNDDGTVHIVFNGEIYNYRELRSLVDTASFRSGTDTEVLLRLYEAFGVDCINHLRGMFAFAIWDERKDRLFLARDRLGQKPLFYHETDKGLLFGSTIQSILADKSVTASPDLDALRQYLVYQYVPTPRTGFAGIRRLPPAHYAVVEDGELQIERYWDLSFADQLTASPAQVADELRGKLREAVRLRLRSDVPLGVFLSGGLDSTIVTALVDELSERPAQTYSIGFDVERFDELSFAGTVADHFDTDHTEYSLSAESMLESVDALVKTYEMPFGDTSALPTYHVSRLASDDITVALSGDASDESFAGYNRYKYQQTRANLRRIPEPVRETLLAAARAVPRQWQGRSVVRYPMVGLEVAAQEQPDAYATFVCHATGPEVKQVWRGSRPADWIPELRRAYERASGPQELDRLMETDIRTYLPDDILVKVDRASMAHSLEVRSPFLDHELVTFAARIPSQYKIRGGTRKWILKRAFDDLVPETVIRREKTGFGVPVDEWIRGRLRSSTERSIERLSARSPFDKRGMRQLFDEHQSRTHEHGYRLWDLLMLERWYEQFID